MTILAFRSLTLTPIPPYPSHRLTPGAPTPLERKKIRHAKKEVDAMGAKLTEPLPMTLGEVLGHLVTQFEPVSDPTRITLHA